MRISALLCIFVGGLISAASVARADNAGPFRLLGAAKVTADGSPSIDITPVRVGTGWHGWGYYFGTARPTAQYAGSYNRVYGYTPSNGYYRGPEGPPPYRRH